MTIRILIAEDHTLVAEGLEVMLSMADEIELVGVVSTADDAVESARTDPVDVVLMDVKLAGETNGIAATREIKDQAPDTKVLILTMFTDPGTVAEAVKAGADGYLSKSSSRDAVLQAVRDVAEGKSVLDPAVTQGVFGTLSGSGRTVLSERELSVLQELTHGKSTREVADSLHLSEETIRTHLKRIFRKLGVRDRAEAVAEAFRRGLVH
ncbi:MAG TPA: response regulator transcription factor [Actinomycetota bacterium]|nr:response regulator transcription factor [Actinomycetota bacterium]